MSRTKFEQAKKDLEDLGYVVDVTATFLLTEQYECTEEDARDILEDVYRELWDTIEERVHDRCENLQFKNKDE
tara:strand:+ start:1452 stop:1670 length:219 start_codon:yes stop_codon:yes gene_type:complete